MTTFEFVSRSLTRACLIPMLLVVPLAVSAQDDGPGRITVRLVDVKGDSVAEFEAAIAEVAKAQQAGGRPFFHVYERLRGDLPAFSIITADGAYTDLPPIELDSGLVARLQHSTNGSTLLSIAVYPEHGISSGSLAPTGEFMQVRVRTVAPSNRQAYHDWTADELVPALRDGGITDYRGGRITLGGNTNTFVRFTFTNAIVGGGPNVAEAIGQQRFDRILAREASLLVGSEDLVYRVRSDLSFTAPQADQ
jgi:hypothetical protein